MRRMGISTQRCCDGAVLAIIGQWIPDSNNVAGELPLGIGSVAVCGAQVGQRNLILTDDAAYAASFTNNGYNLSVIGTGCGAMSTNSLAVMNSRAYWPSKKSICYYDGQQVTALECSIKTRFATKISQYQANKIFSWRNVEYNEIWMHYPHSDEGLEVSPLSHPEFAGPAEPVGLRHHEPDLHGEGRGLHKSDWLRCVRRRLVSRHGL